MNNAVSPIVASLLLILIVVSGAIVIYVLINNYLRIPSTDEVGLGGSISIEEVDPVEDEASDNHYFALDVYVRNTGGKPLFIPGDSSLYLLKENSLVSRMLFVTYGSLDGVELDPGEIVVLRCYSSDMVSEGKYTLKIVSQKGVSDKFLFNLEGIMGKSTIEKVYVGNDSSNPVVIEDKYAIYKAWESLDGSNYNITFQVYAKSGVTIKVVRAEIFNSDGEHPAWIGSWSIWHYTIPYTYPDYAGAYWTPVAPSEMPVTIIYTVYTE